MTLDKIEDAVRRAAKSVAHQWPGVVENDDIEQMIWLKLLEEPNTVKTAVELDKKAMDRFVTRIGHQLASQERTDYDYYKGSYRYSLKEVKDLLDQGILTEPLKAFKAELLDINDALDEVSDSHANAIWRRYAEHESTKDDKQFENALMNGLESLVSKMNQVQKRRYAERTDGPGTRGQASTENHYDGGSFDFEQFAQAQGIGWD